MTTLLVGARDPEALRVTLTPGNSGLDMRNVTSCALHVTRPDGTAVVWSTVLQTATLTSVEALHVFDADGLEVGLPGNYVIEPRILAPGSRRCRLFKLSVTPYPTP
jgi:hypothetical protein